MKIQYQFGDLFGKANIIIHGCNAQGKMASGFAKTLREKHPIAYQAYMEEYVNHSLKVGNVVWARDREVLIGNAITQTYYGRNSNILYANYLGIRKAFQEVNKTTKTMGGKPMVSMPMIGAGFANGDWQIISDIIVQESYNFTPVVYVLDEDIYRKLLKQQEENEQPKES